jgi:DNA-binding CsgD family transcriptional regulator
MKRGLELSISGGLDEEPARIFGNLACVALDRLDLAARMSYCEAGLAYCEKNELYSRALHLWATLAETCFWSGDWARATELCEYCLHSSHVRRIDVLVTLARMRSRRRQPEVWPLLDEAMQLAVQADELQGLAPVAAARAEAHWLSGHPERVVDEVRAPYELAVALKVCWPMGELGWWLWRVGELTSAPAGTLSPFARQIRGDWHGAAREWADNGFPYESAMALTDSLDETDLLAALGSFDSLGATPALEMVRRRLRGIGAAAPRGPRPTTRSNPAQLTRREVEVLAMVERGLTDADISRAMFVSTRTVNHHVSSILTKLDVKSRAEAVEKAAQLLASKPTKT